ncbi:MAG: four helix bundle protein [Phycisphaerales bacterium]|jgi:four helix bundle protein|nr:four helix bundle protein [Phycisphaerales bacterium]
MGDKKYNNPEINDYRDLMAWQKARTLVKRIYGATRLFPTDEMYGLTQQIRRAAVSVPSNIAEGYGRGSLGDYIRFLQIARGSLFELETQVILANDLEYLTEKQTDSLIEDMRTCTRVLQGLITKLKGKQ